ncbi:unnamed protein product [Trichogramma brassicae]|uniref:Uncharacterized protein n=1 Tax=Trichogramma brassicae TaxID=86971 RepID=A0A6H5ISZ5_9HYME|nr:unnamed protein product [Trichogramma brassicae]
MKMTPNGGRSSAIADTHTQLHGDATAHAGEVEYSSGTYRYCTPSMAARSSRSWPTLSLAWTAAGTHSSRSRNYKRITPDHFKEDLAWNNDSYWNESSSRSNIHNNRKQLPEIPIYYEENKDTSNVYYDNENGYHRSTTHGKDTSTTHGKDTLRLPLQCSTISSTSSYSLSTPEKLDETATRSLDEQRLVEHLYARSSPELVEASHRRAILCDVGLRPYFRKAQASRLFCKALPVTRVARVRVQPVRATLRNQRIRSFETSGHSGHRASTSIIRETARHRSHQRVASNYIQYLQILLRDTITSKPLYARTRRDILGYVYVGLTSTAWVVRSYVAPLKSASAGTSRPECVRENQWIQRPSRPQGQPRSDLVQEKISTSCGESSGSVFGRCVCVSYAPYLRTVVPAVDRVFGNRKAKKEAEAKGNKDLVSELNSQLIEARANIKTLDKLNIEQNFRDYRGQKSSSLNSTIEEESDQENNTTYVNVEEISGTPIAQSTPHPTTTVIKQGILNFKLQDKEAAPEPKVIQAFIDQLDKDELEVANITAEKLYESLLNNTVAKNEEPGFIENLYDRFKIFVKNPLQLLNPAVTETEEHTPKKEKTQQQHLSEEETPEEDKDKERQHPQGGNMGTEDDKDKR